MTTNLNMNKKGNFGLPEFSGFQIAPQTENSFMSMSASNAKDMISSPTPNYANSQMPGFISDPAQIMAPNPYQGNSFANSSLPFGQNQRQFDNSVDFARQKFNNMSNNSHSASSSNMASSPFYSAQYTNQNTGAEQFGMNRFPMKYAGPDPMNNSKALDQVNYTQNQRPNTSNVGKSAWPSDYNPTFARTRALSIKPNQPGGLADPTGLSQPNMAMDQPFMNHAGQTGQAPPFPMQSRFIPGDMFKQGGGLPNMNDQPFAPRAMDANYHPQEFYQQEQLRQMVANAQQYQAGQFPSNKFLPGSSRNSPSPFPQVPKGSQEAMFPQYSTSPKHNGPHPMMPNIANTNMVDRNQMPPFPGPSFPLSPAGSQMSGKGNFGSQLSMRGTVSPNVTIGLPKKQFQQQPQPQPDESVLDRGVVPSTGNQNAAAAAAAAAVLAAINTANNNPPPHTSPTTSGGDMQHSIPSRPSSIHARDMNSRSPVTSLSDHKSESGGSGINDVGPVPSPVRSLPQNSPQVATPSSAGPFSSEVATGRVPSPSVNQLPSSDIEAMIQSVSNIPNQAGFMSDSSSTNSQRSSNKRERTKPPSALPKPHAGSKLSPVTPPSPFSLSPSITDFELDILSPSWEESGGTAPLSKVYKLSDEPERKLFLDRLVMLSDQQGKGLREVPVFNGAVLDLFKFFKLVSERGGFNEVLRMKHWREVIQELMNNSEPNPVESQNLRDHYTRIILPHEAKLIQSSSGPTASAQQPPPPSQQPFSPATSQPRSNSTSGGATGNFPSPGPPTPSASQQHHGNSSIDLSALNYKNLSNMYPTNVSPFPQGNAPQLPKPYPPLPSQAHQPPNYPAGPHQMGSGYQHHRSTPTGYPHPTPPGHYPTGTPPHYPTQNPAPPGYPQVSPYHHQYNNSLPQPGYRQPGSATYPPPENPNMYYNEPLPQSSDYRLPHPSPHTIPNKPPGFQQQQQYMPPEGQHHPPPMYHHQNFPPPQHPTQRHPPPSMMYPTQPHPGVGGNRNLQSIRQRFGRPQSGGPPPASPQWGHKYNPPQQSNHPPTMDHHNPGSTHHSQFYPSQSNAARLPRPSQPTRGAPPSYPVQPKLEDSANAHISSTQHLRLGVQPSPRKEEALFPSDCIESTKPSFIKKRRLTARDIGPVEAWRIMMSLKSGLLTETAWALDTLTILLCDDTTVGFFRLAHLPGLLDIVVELYRRTIINVFGVLSEAEVSTGVPRQFMYSSKDEDDELSKATSYAEKVKHFIAPDNFSAVIVADCLDEEETGEEGSSTKRGCFSSGIKDWIEGGGDTTSHIQTHFETTAEFYQERSKAVDDEVCKMEEENQEGDRGDEEQQVGNPGSEDCGSGGGELRCDENMMEVEGTIVDNGSKIRDVKRKVEDMKEQCVIKDEKKFPSFSCHQNEPDESCVYNGIPSPQRMKAKRAKILRDSHRNNTTTTKLEVGVVVGTKVCCNGGEGIDIVQKDDKKTRELCQSPLKMETESSNDSLSAENARDASDERKATFAENVKDMSSQNIKDSPAGNKSRDLSADLIQRLKTELDLDVDSLNACGTSSSSSGCDTSDGVNSTTTATTKTDDEGCELRHEFPLSTLNWSQDQAVKCCLCVSNIIRSLSFIPRNDMDMARHPSLMLILGRLFLLHHLRKKVHGVKTQEGMESYEYSDKQCWWNECLEIVRENALVTVANIAGYLDLSLLSQNVSSPILDGLLHWLVCQSATAVDSFRSISPNHSPLSPKNLALETLAKMSVLQSNVDHILSSPDKARLTKAYEYLVKLFSDKSNEVTREFALVLLSSLTQSNEVISNSQLNLVTVLVGYLEDATHTVQSLAARGLHPGVFHEDDTRVSVGMLRRASGLLACIAKRTNSAHLIPFQERILSLSMSQLLDIEVQSHLCNVLYNLPR